jgi:hypothetical protein
MLKYCTQQIFSDQDSDVSWMHFGNQIISVPWSHTIPNYNTTECLRACLVGQVEGCSSVWHQKRTQTCVLTKATRAAGGLVLTTVLSTDLSGGDYWEAYRGGMELFYWSNLDPVLNLNRIKINC